MLRRLATFGVVLLAIAVLYLAASQTMPSAGSAATAQPATSSAGTTVAVTSVTRACPPPGPGTGIARVAMVAVPGQEAASQAAGSAQLRAMPVASAAAAGQGTAPVSVTTPGTLALETAPQPAQYGGTAVSATGAMAPGFEAEDATASGVGMVSCTHPGSDMWFVGAGEQAGAPTTLLYLMNTGTVAASVEATLLTDAGVQQGLSSAITVGPGRYLSVNLAQYVRGSVVIAVHVQAITGQIAAAVWQGPARGPGGTWLPQAAEPATQVVIPGLTTASSAARLFVVVPGATDARVKVEALTAHGPFLPFGTALQDAPAGASSSIALTALGASAASLVLTSNVPITAGIAVPGTGIGSFTAAVGPVSGQGVVAGNPGGKQGSVGLILSAPDGAASASITVIPAAVGTAQPGKSPQPGQTTQSAPQAVQVAAGRTIQVTLQPPAGNQPFAIVVTPHPGSGPLYAARVVTSGSGLSGPVISILPVPSAPTEVTLPPARDSYTAILP
jgi:Family of unknown function (DUF5719)